MFLLLQLGLPVKNNLAVVCRSGLDIYTQMFPAVFSLRCVFLFTCPLAPGTTARRVVPFRISSVFYLTNCFTNGNQLGFQSCIKMQNLFYVRECPLFTQYRHADKTFKDIRTCKLSLLAKGWGLLWFLFAFCVSAARQWSGPCHLTRIKSPQYYIYFLILCFSQFFKPLWKVLLGFLISLIVWTSKQLAASNSLKAN